MHVRRARSRRAGAVGPDSGTTGRAGSLAAAGVARPSLRVVGRGVLRGAAVVALVLLAPGPRGASADVVVTGDGATYEGKVVIQDEATVVIETTFAGRVELPRAKVKSIDTKVPPLRDQFDFRLHEARDVAALTDLAGWAKAKGFTTEIEQVWKRVLELDPKNVKAHKALGHVKVGDAWVSPQEKAAADKAAEEDALRAKGLVPYEGRWVTKEEKEALEKGLMKDGDVWVTEEEFHRRRGEKKVDGAWIRVGEAEAKKRAEAVAKATGATIKTYWSPHVDLFTEVEEKDAQTILVAAAKSVDAFFKVLAPAPDDRLWDLRLSLYVFQKQPTYARFTEAFGKENDIAAMGGPMETWAKRSGKERSWWWPEPAAAAHYLFPNTAKVIGSNAGHNLANVLFTKWMRWTQSLPPNWLLEGLAYVAEMEGSGYSASFNVGKGGGGESQDVADWQDSEKWKTVLPPLQAAGRDTPISRLAKAGFGDSTIQDLVKTWSVLDLLRKTDTAKLRAFLAGVKAAPASAQDVALQEAALRSAYGFDFAALDAKWRAYVKGGFKAP